MLVRAKKFAFCVSNATAQWELTGNTSRPIDVPERHTRCSNIPLSRLTACAAVITTVSPAIFRLDTPPIVNDL